MKKSQRQIILELLQERGEEGVKSFEGYQMYIPRLAAIIHQLKRDRYKITTERIAGTNEVVYKLVGGVAKSPEEKKTQKNLSDIGVRLEEAKQGQLNLDTPFE